MENEPAAQRQIDHFSHPHPLHSLIPCAGATPGKCFGCDGWIRDDDPDPLYVCKLCGYCLHKSCAEVPREIRHPSHPLHPLTLFVESRDAGNQPLLYPVGFVRCDACYCDRRGFIFFCAECKYTLCVPCAVPSGTATYEHHQDQIDHFSHQHPLIPCDDWKITDEVRCRVCSLPLLGAIYGCNRCDYFLHKSCAELPREVEHPFHPPHLLRLLANPYDTSGNFYCDACLKTREGFTFHCRICDFDLNVDCAMLIPTIKFYGHGHPLCLFKGPFDTRCKVCCSSGTATYIFRCVECDFNIHLQCGPLPNTVEPKCHIHPLTLADSVPDNDLDELYCDVCEKRRNAADRVYYCAECRYVAHIECVMLEVRSWLERESSVTHQPGEAKLETSITDVLRISREEVTKALAAVQIEPNDAADPNLVKLEQNDAAAPTLAELDEAMANLEAEIEAVGAKFKALASKFKAFVRKHRSSSLK